MIIFKNILLGIFIVIIILYDYYDILYRKELFIKNKDIIKELNKSKKIYNNKEKEYKENLDSLKKEEIDLKNKQRSINNDIAFYEHELSKHNNKTLSKENSYNKEDKVFRK